MSTLAHTTLVTGRVEAQPPRAKEMRAGVYRGPGPRGHRIRAGARNLPTAKCSCAWPPAESAARTSRKFSTALSPRRRFSAMKSPARSSPSGRGVRRWKLGDRVVSFHHVPCGRCFYCDRRLFSQCPAYKKVGLTAGFDPNGGGFAEYVRAMPWIAERGMVEIPAGVSFEEATFVEPVNTCLKAIEKARVAAGETVVVMGQGPVGLLLHDAGPPGRRHRSDQRPDAGAPRRKRAFRRRRGLRSRRQVCKRRFAPAPKAAALTLCWSRSRFPPRCPRPWRSRGPAGASCCLRRTIRT